MAKTSGGTFKAAARERCGIIARSSKFSKPAALRCWSRNCGRRLTNSNGSWRKNRHEYRIDASAARRIQFRSGNLRSRLERCRRAKKFRQLLYALLPDRLPPGSCLEPILNNQSFTSLPSPLSPLPYNLRSRLRNGPFPRAGGKANRPAAGDRSLGRRKSIGRSDAASAFAT